MKRIFIITGLVVALLAGLSEAQKPDVLFIAIDDMNDWTTLFNKNNPIKTPNLECWPALDNLL